MASSSTHFETYRVNNVIDGDLDGGSVFYDADGVPRDETDEERTRRVYGDMLRADSRPRICLYCNAQPVLYRETANVGRLECRYHPGVLEAGRYTCCLAAPRQEGQGVVAVTPGSHGCTKCDHTPALIGSSTNDDGSAMPSAVDNLDTDTPFGSMRWHQANMVVEMPQHLRQVYLPLDRCVLTATAAPARTKYVLPEHQMIRVLRVDPLYVYRDVGR